MAGDEDRWRKVLEQSSLPPFLRDALIAKGYLTASIFSHSFPDNETLEKFLENFLLSADAAPLGLVLGGLVVLACSGAPAAPLV